MLLRIGDEAASTARELGLLDIQSMPKLSKEDWQTVLDNWQSHVQANELTLPGTGIAVATESGVSIYASREETRAILPCEVLGAERESLLSCNASLTDGKHVAKVPKDIIQAARFIRYESAGALFNCIVQHQNLIEENSRTGTQRRFREALASLNTDSPDLETLIRCVDKIIFSKADEVNRVKPPHGPESGQEKKTSEVGGALSVDVSDTKKTKRKFRLQQSDDLAYLLDVLIYHLRQEDPVALDTSMDARDAKGRSEEEQVGAEDDEGRKENGQTEDEMAAKMLSLCQSKVRTLVSRMLARLNDLTSGKYKLSDIIVRLTAVLAVIRQLRHCDGKVSWIRPGQTSVLIEQREKLLLGIVRNLFEAPNSIIYSPQDLDDADELARLKGLILWLAWDSGIRISKSNWYLEVFRRA